MRWYVINPIDGEIELEEADDGEGHKRVVSYLKDEDRCARFSECEVSAKEMIVIRGERHYYEPPTGEARLIRER